MTKFNPEGKSVLTYGECLGPAMKITDPEDARQYFDEYVKFIEVAMRKEPRNDEKTAADIARINLGYYAGYYDEKTRECVERLFMCAHPIFGSISKNGAPTADEAFAAGLKAGAK